MKLKHVLFAAVIAWSTGAVSQTKSNKPAGLQTPKLVVGIVVDQMRVDYLYRYWSRYGEGGFRRLVTDGFFCRNAHYNYVPTFTGPGHSSIYTGTTPSMHGIIANEWYDKEKGYVQYCSWDNDVKPVGSDSKAGMMSPRQQLTTTMGDELKLASNGRSKVFGVALKDRSSILPVGHAADGAFWFDDASGGFISSSWYMNELPAWVKQYNDKKNVKAYLEKGWTTLYPIDSYKAGIADENKYESAPNKKEKAVFPYEYQKFIEKGDWGVIKATPWGNTITKEMAIECLKNEALGKDEFPDMLCISFSSTDIIAHAYGPRALEMEDVYLRLDKDLDELLKALDAEVGRDNYTVFLTADHGGADVPNYLKDLKIPAGYLKEWNVRKELKEFCAQQFGDSLVRNLSNQQVFLNEEKMEAMKLSKDAVESAIAARLVKMEGVAEAYPSAVLKYEVAGKSSPQALVAAGYNQKRSGNVAFSYMPGWLDIGETGTTHGAAYNYDTHVPLILYGFGIKKGGSVKQNYITEIAPTICLLLNISLPSGCFSGAIEEAMK